MKIIAWTTKPEPAERVIHLILRQIGDSVTLAVSDQNGETKPGWQLLTITSDGNLVLHTGVEPGLGLKLNAHKLAVYNP